MKKSEVKEDTELVIVCSYCGLLLKGSETRGDSETNTTVNKSHGICPSCLLENYPDQYLFIQQKWRIRIKNAYKNGYPDLSHKLNEDK